ncbi:hypothetical protein QTP88_009590 [Uroleucon formosanum]
MSDEKLINLNLKIFKLTDIYLLKKPDLISLCTSKKLKNTGTVENLRSRLSKYYKGVAELDDIEDTLTEKEKNTILTESLNNKFEINELLAEYDLAGDSNSESNNENTETPKLKLNKLKEINNKLNNKANKLSTQADSILDTSNQLYQNIIDQNTNYNYNNINPGITINKKEHYYEDIELIKSNETQSNLNNTYFNKPIIRIKTPDQPPIINTSKMVNNNMIIKPDSFSGQGDIKLFFKQYEKAALINNWDNNDKITFLSILLKDTAGTFLENLESIKTHWSWEELKNEFLKEFQSIGHAILLKTKLENRKQEDTESIMSFVTDIENLCRQVEKNMKEEDICTYILKGLKEPILNAISLHDNSNLGKIKENLKKYELMQFRINSRGPPGFNEYTEILNKQIMQVGKYSKDRVEELSAKIDQLTNSTKKPLKQFRSNEQNESIASIGNVSESEEDNTDNNPIEDTANYTRSSFIEPNPQQWISANMKLMNPKQKRRFKVGVLNLMGNILDEHTEPRRTQTEQNFYHAGFNREYPREYQNMENRIIYSTTPSSLSSPSTSMPVSPPLDLVQQSNSLQLNQNNFQNWSYQ